MRHALRLLSLVIVVVGAVALAAFMVNEADPDGAVWWPLGLALLVLNLVPHMLLLRGLIEDPLRRSSAWIGLIGALAVVGGLAAMMAGDSAMGVAGMAGVAGGAYLFKSGMDKGAQARIHAEALTEMAESMGGDMRPHHISLRDQTLTLSGTVEEQYAQWRGLLRDIYAAEHAGAPPDMPLITYDAVPPAPAP